MSKRELSASSVGERIKEARERLGYNQAKLSSEAQITPAAISQIEAGDRTPSTPILRRVASVLKVSTDYLLGNSNETQLQDLVQDEGIQKFFRGFKELSSKDQQTIQEQIEFLRSRKTK